MGMLQQRLATFVVVMVDMGMEVMVDTVDMVDTDTMERDLLKLMLNQDTSEDMVDMAMAVEGYGGYGYGRGYYGKREAEAEPGYLRGYGGYGRGYGYGGYGYGGF